MVIVDFRPTLGKSKTRHADKMYTFVHNLTLRRKAALFLQSIRHKYRKESPEYPGTSRTSGAFSRFG